MTDTYECYSCKKTVSMSLLPVDQPCKYFNIENGERVMTDWWKDNYCHGSAAQFVGKEQCGNCLHTYDQHTYKEQAKAFGNGAMNCMIDMGACKCIFFFPKSLIAPKRD